MIACVLSFLELGWARSAPEGCIEGDELTSSQKRACERIVRACESWADVTISITPAILGRITDKYMRVVKIYDKLLPWAVALRKSLDPYLRLEIRIPNPLKKILTGLENIRMKTLYASRIIFTKGLAEFWPKSYLCRSSFDAYADPGVLVSDSPPGPRECGDFCTGGGRRLNFTSAWTLRGCWGLPLHGFVRKF